ncbi:MAG: thymidine kinase [Myxococcales bacterium]|nr:thymidine kinase [Myxococcales bacterium]
MPRAFPVGTGWIEVVTGCMFSGKTEELIRRLNRATYATQRVCVFKPSIDVRYAEAEVVSHSAHRFVSRAVDHAADILKHVGNAQVVGVDEAQFFGADLVEVAEQLANEGRRVVVAGLDQDYKGQPFGPVPNLMAVAEYVTKTLAVCMVCGAPANRTQRLVRRERQVLIGAQETYEARCRLHWNPEPFEPQQQRLPLPNLPLTSTH